MKGYPAVSDLIDNATKVFVSKGYLQNNKRPSLKHINCYR